MPTWARVLPRADGVLERASGRRGFEAGSAATKEALQPETFLVGRPVLAATAPQAESTTELPGTKEIMPPAPSAGGRDSKVSSVFEALPLVEVGDRAHYEIQPAPARCDKSRY